MLRSKKFRPFEVKLLSAVALLLMPAAVVGIVLAIHRADWRILFASLGIAGLAVLYLSAAKRGKPL
jgi:hypothetical protein